MTASISVVTPTLDRPEEVRGLLLDLAEQTRPPAEIQLVDASAGNDTAEVVERLADRLPFSLVYHRRSGGTAVQRNHGIDRASGRFIAFIDDDIRLEADFFERILAAYADDTEGRVGGIAGYIANQFLDPATSRRWRWYRRLRLFSTYEPGRYDFASGYPINRYLQPPHDGLREIDFMGAGCAVWRRQVFDRGLRFDEFFRDFGVLEDAHLALRARTDWVLLEHGGARATHLKSPRARVAARQIGYKSAVNYRYVFLDIVRERRAGQELRFWLVQGVDCLRMIAWALGHPGGEAWGMVRGKIAGILAAARLAPRSDESPEAP